MRYISLFSGIEAASVAWHSLGWQPLAFCEIDPFPSAVLKHRFPHVPNLGDVTKVDWHEFRRANGPIDLVVFGSPCQSFSVAGKRLGLDDPRGNLALYSLAVIDALRPEWFIFENVPGLLSSDGGRDFGAFLGNVDDIGYSCAWRVLDAQYVRTREFPRAVPQRRRRVFAVGHTDWRRAAAVLLDRESLQGNPPPRREAGKRTAPTLSAHTRGGGGLGTDFDCDGGLIASSGSVPHCLNVGGQLAVAFDLRGREGGAMPEGPHDTANIRAASGGSSRSYVAFAQNSRDEVRLFGDDGQTVGALAAEGGMKQTCYLAYAMQAGVTRENPASGPDGVGVQEDIAYTLEARAEVQAVASQWAVRRLTPTECARLQGFPCDWARIPWRGRPASECPDGPMYKAYGNSMAVPVMQLIGHRIAMVRSIP